MGKFASDCLLKMRQLVHDLETVLGPETSNLTLRVGLHSGESIALYRCINGIHNLIGSLTRTIPASIKIRSCYRRSSERRQGSLPAVWRHHEYW